MHDLWRKPVAEHSMRKQAHAAVVGVFVAATLAVPTAQARHAPGEDAKAFITPSAVPQSTAPASVVKVVGPAGFDWSDAGIGAGAAGGALTLAAALALLATRRSRTNALPEQRELAGA
jgi:hypothetical protein